MLLVAMPGAPSSFLPPSSDARIPYYNSVLAPSSDARSPYSSILAPSSDPRSPQSSVLAPSIAMPGAPFVASLLLVAMPGTPSACFRLHLSSRCGSQISASKGSGAKLRKYYEVPTTCALRRVRQWCQRSASWRWIL